jgi:hypothetical protein
MARVESSFEKELQIICKEEGSEGKSPGALEAEKCFPGYKDWELVGRVAKPEYEPSFYQGNDRKTPGNWRRRRVLESGKC